MKTIVAASVLIVTVTLGGSAWAQVDPGYAQPAYPQQQYPQPAYGQPYPQQPPYPQQQPYAQPYDPNAQPQEMAPAGNEPYGQGDSDPDIDGYDADTDVYYDNVAAQGYDDGYDANAYQQFDSALAPYGNWFEDPSYGRVWAPSAGAVGEDFSPYSTGGHWVLTEYGWTWVSDWDWGWGPFHYGRWTNIGSYGWCWIPGTAWGPAWVSWRSGGGYVGWSPLPPAGVVVGPPRGVRSPWRFTVASQLGATRPSYLPAHVVPSVFARTSVINNAHSVNIGNVAVRVNAGPTGTFVGAGVGVSTPARLASIAPHAGPHAAIAPRLGTALNARPWVQARVANLDPRVVRSFGGGYQQHAPYAGPRPMQPAQQRMAPPRYIPPATPRSIYSPGPRYQAPVYTPPAQRYSQPVYSAPAQHYSPPAAYHYNNSYAAPHYSAPSSYGAPHYSAPAYSAPATHYSAPATHYSAPAASHSFSAPSSHGGGGHR